MENQTNSTRFKRTPIKSIVVFVVFFAIAVLGTQCTMKPSEDVQLKEMVEKMDKGCPIQFDPYTSLKSVVLLPNKTVQYNYAISELTKAEINLDTAQKYVYPDLLKKIKESPDAKPLRDLKVTLKHCYSDKNGELIVEYVITPEMYQTKRNNRTDDKKSSI